MNQLLQEHGCSNVFSVPEGLKELMSDITREVLREQPSNMYDFISNYLSVMMITREHGVMAVKILDDLCDCRPSVSQHLMALGIDEVQASSLAEIIRDEIESVQPLDGKETIKEYQIIKRILKKSALDELTTAKVCQVARNAYRDYWYRKKTLEKSLKIKPEEAWEVAAQRTLELYKRTKPSLGELTRATEKIQAAYRGYHVRRNLLRHLKPKQKKKGPKVGLPGPPLDVAESREFELGPLLSINVRDDDINAMFDEDATEKLGLMYDPMKTITHIPDEEYEEAMEFPETTQSRLSEAQLPSLGGGRSQMQQSRAPSMANSQSADGDLEYVQHGASFHGTLPQAHVEDVSNKVLREGYIEDVSSPRPSHDSQEDIALQKISFAAVKPVVIPDESEVVEDDHEIKEVLAAPDDGTDTEEKADEVPEDIAASEDEGESAPTASLPMTNDTDEEGLQDILDEEEG